MARASTNPIENLQQDWGLDQNTQLPFSGQSVQTFIKSYLQRVIGAAWFDPSNYTLYFFENEEDRDAFANDTSLTSLIKFSCPMNFSSTLYRVNITNNTGATVINTATNAGTLPLSVSFMVQSKDLTAQTWDDLQTACFVTVYIDRGLTGNYVAITERELYTAGSTIELDVFDELIIGTSRVRFTFEAEDGTVTQSLVFTVTMAELYVAMFNNTWYLPILGNNSDTHYLGGFRIGGAGSKTIHFNIYDPQGTQVVNTIDELIGTTNMYANTPYFYRPSSSSPILSLPTGTYRVRVWVTTDNMTSEYIEYNIMIVSALDTNTARLVVVNEVAERVYNYSTSEIAKYAIYNGGLSSGDVTITFTKMDGDTPSGSSSEPKEGIVTSSPIVLTYAADWDVTGDGYSIAFSVIHGDASDGATVPLDNSTVFPPQAGYDFYLNAATRGNGDTDRTSVINSVTGQSLAAQWSNVDFVDGVDGWTVDDKGRKCLRIPAGSSFTLPASSFRLFSSDNITFEICYKVANTADFDENVITLASNPSSAGFTGLRVRPTNITMHSNNDTDAENDVKRGTNVSDEETIHFVATINRNAARGNDKLVLGYVNGCKNFAFSDNNAWSWNINGDLVIAPDKSDIFLYFVRRYPVVLQEPMVQNNYISSLTTVEERAATLDDFSSCMDAGYTNVDLEAVKNSGYNYFIVHMENNVGVPSKANGWSGSDDTKMLSSLEMHFGQHPEWDWWIYGVETGGQGTTSMNYFRWNIRWRIDKSDSPSVRYLSSRTRVAGSYQYTWGPLFSSSTVHFDGEGNHPAVKRITAKINQASSMQSHKMGATMAYTAIHDQLGLENEAQAKARTEGKPHPSVAVYQYPAFGFQDDGNGNYSFCGLFTIGPDKGDKPTFGYDLVKNSLITMEGTDHSQPLARFDHPWGSDVNFFYTQEGLAIAMPDGSYLTGLEVGNCHGNDTDKASGQSACRTVLETEFKPAYDLVWNNSTLIFPIALNSGYGANVSQVLANINSDDAEARRAFRETSYDGRLKYGDMQFWIEGDRRLYYYDIKTDRYVAGQQLGTKSGTLTEQNEAYKADRRAAFMASAENYFHIDESIYHFLFLLIFGATDNHAKNMYPYKMAALANGGRWRWIQDDLDTLFDIDNSGGDTKPYMIEFSDGNNGTPYFAGSSSIFWNLLFECYWSDYTSTATGLPASGIKSWGYRFIKAMTALSRSRNDYEGFVNCIRMYFWDKAQEYFPSSGYNVDQNFKYEQAYFGGDNGGVPALQQELGNHYSAEQLWVRRRAVYMLSLFGAGAFGDYSDASLGTLQFRPMSFSTTVVPAMWLYPSIGVGQNTPINAGRTEPGEAASLTATGADGETFVYLLGTNYMSSLGNLKTLRLASGYVSTLEVPGKMLTSFAIGGASGVTTNVPGLSFGTEKGHTNCLEVIDARNASSIRNVNIAAVPRLRELYLAGTSVTSIEIPRGSKIHSLSLPSSIQSISFRDLKHLPYSSVAFSGYSNITSITVENSLTDALKVLADVMSGSSALEYIRCIWTENVTDSDGSILSMLSSVAQGDYKGLNPDGAELPTPVIEGPMTLTGTIPISTYGPVAMAFPNIIFNDSVNDQVYVDFADSNVATIALANWDSDSSGTLSLREVKAVTSISSAIFQNKTNIVSFNEFVYFTGLTEVRASLFQGATALQSVSIPSTAVLIGGSAFQGCSSLTTVGDMSNVETISDRAFYNARLTGAVNLPMVTSINNYAFSGNTYMTSVKLPRIMTLTGSNSATGGPFEGCTSLVSAELNDNLSSLGTRCFYGCTALADFTFPSKVAYIYERAFENCSSLNTTLNLVNLTTLERDVFSHAGTVLDVNCPNLTSFGYNCFYMSGVVRISNLGKITALPDGNNQGTVGAFARCESLVSATLPSTMVTTGVSSFYQCTALTTVTFPTSLQTVSNYSFYGCTSLTGELSLPQLATLGTNAFYNTRFTKIVSLGSVTTIGDGTNNSNGPGMFSLNTTLTELTLPNTMGYVGHAAFTRCTALTTINFGTGTTSLGNYVFYGCSALSSPVVLSAITTTGSSCFYGCTSLATVDIGSACTSIGASCFYGCSSLTTLIVRATTPPSLGNNALTNTNAGLRIYVPYGKGATYKAATNWSAQSSKIYELDQNGNIPS